MSGIELQRRQVVVIGAGPSGAIASALLKRNGHDVLVIERQHFPRFSIGESLLSHCLDFVEEAGMLEAVQAAILKMINIDRRKDDQDGWRYISVIKAQMKRRKFYQQIQKQLDGANQDAMQNALAMLGGKIEMDPSGKQIRMRK